jgi:transposase
LTYLRQLEARGYEPGQTDIDQQEIDRILDALLPTNRRSRNKRDQLVPYRDELIRLVNPPDQPADAVKPKTAWLILKEKYGLEVSYETFKLYARQIGLAAQRNRPPTTIEQPPGQETQIDYGNVGTLSDPVTGTDRRVQAFAAKLSHSRLPFIQFTYTQNSESFVLSNIRMVEFYGGVTECLLIDNLKAGVLKPHIWDPQINRAYAEFAEHYGTFIDTARVRIATDKAKVERLIPQARELFRRLKALHPTFTLEELNREALQWCREEYGRTRHGTTGIEPMVLFEEAEKATLKPLPTERFEVPLYKPVTVHADRFFTFEKKRYAMPETCRGKSFIARKSGTMLRVFDSSYRLLRSYPITGKRVSWLPGDFPESEEALMNGTYPRYLCSQARTLGPAAERLITELLKPHAWVKARLARGVLSVLEEYRTSPFLQDICSQALRDRVFSPKQIKAMLERENSQYHFAFVSVMSEAGKAMTRDIHDYLN